MLDFKDFKENKHSYTYVINIEGIPLNLNINQKKDSKMFKIIIYGKDVNSTFLTQTEDFNELNNIVKEICKDIELIYRVSPNPDITAFINQTRKEYGTNTKHRKSRTRKISTDNKIEMFVEKNRDGFYAMVLDYEIREKTICKGQLAPLCATEDEAERIIEKRMNQYECFGFYDRILIKKPKNQLKYESRSKSGNLLFTEEYIIDNLSKDKYDFLMKQSKIYDESLKN